MQDSKFKINLPKGLKKAVSKCPLIIGVAPNAWPRVIPSFFLEKYKILTYFDAGENQAIKDAGIEIFSLQEDNPEFELSPLAASRIIEADSAVKFFNSQKEPFRLLIYKETSRLAKVAEEKGMVLIGNSKEVKDIYEDKRIFREVLEKVGIKPIPGENILIEDLDKQKFKAFQEKFGQKNLVLQLAEVTYGGGSGTLFIEDKKDLSLFRKRVSEIREKLENSSKEIKTVNVSPFINSISASISCCATKNGTLMGPIQTQIIDIKEVGAKRADRSGNFCGHDWSYKHYSKKIQDQAQEIAQKFGKYMYEHGYRGIFGLDLLIEEEKEKLWPMECNPRFTDAFPVISFLFLRNNLVPMEIFHILELLNIDYSFSKAEFDSLNESYKKDFDAAHIILHNLLNEEAINGKGLKAGVYVLNNDKLKYLCPGFSPLDLKEKGEFLFTEGVPQNPGKYLSPFGRVCRLIVNDRLLDSPSEITPQAKKILSETYKELDLKEEKTSELIDFLGLKILRAKNELRARRSMDLKNAEMIEIKDFVAGSFYRPSKIVWRKTISKKPILDQLKSKRLAKQLEKDLDLAEFLSIEFEVNSGLDESLFKDWLSLYKDELSKKERGRLVIDDNWLKEKQKTGKKPGAVLAYKEGKLVGGNLFYPLSEKLSVGYGASKKIEELSSGLGALLDYYTLVYAKRQGFKEISFGQDTNLYGFHLSPGLLFYKAKLGFKPIVTSKIEYFSTFFLSLDKFEDPLMFFSGKPENLELTVIADKKPEDLENSLPEGISKINFFKKEEVLKKHQDFFNDKD